MRIFDEGENVVFLNVGDTTQNDKKGLPSESKQMQAAAAEREEQPDPQGNAVMLLEMDGSAENLVGSSHSLANIRPTR